MQRLLKLASGFCTGGLVSAALTIVANDWVTLAVMFLTLDGGGGTLLAVVANE